MKHDVTSQLTRKSITKIFGTIRKNSSTALLDKYLIMKFTIAVVLFIPSSVLSFSSEGIFSRRDRTATKIKISSQVHGDDMSSQGKTELWLDLRQNLIDPKVAVEQLETQIGSKAFIDRVLLSGTVYQRIKDSTDMYSVSPQVLYQSSQKGDVLLSPMQDISSPFGYSLSAPNDAEIPIEDPVKAIQLISGGKWLILENDGGGIDNDNESLRINAVGNFLDIVSSSVINDEWDCSPQTGGLVLPKTNTKKQTSSSNSNLGGVAVACETQLEIMQLASTLQLKQGENMETIN